LVDFDGDLYSPVFIWRGSAWRGRDCDDIDPNVYPGRNVGNHYYDHNCNGIYGGNSSGNYEDLFCAGSGQMGIGILGDSTGAHFGVPIAPLATPSQWVTAIELEFDAPHCSWATGFETNAKKCEVCYTTKSMDSIYYRMWKRNHCNFRDYQNIAVNGARSPSIADFTKATSRNQKVDHPMIMLYNPAANDVCNPHMGSNYMTTPKEFYANNLNILQQLDAKLPPGSHVVLVGLFHGDMIYESMYTQAYPYFSQPGNTFTYGNFWALGDEIVVNPNSNGTINACWAWLNADPYWRMVANTRARQLDATFLQLIQNEAHNFKNFDLYYMDHPDKEVITDWIAAGNEAWQLFEADDGAHPSQTANVLWAEYIWRNIEKNWPWILGNVNPYNAEIEAMFGDQGGY